VFDVVTTFVPLKRSIVIVIVGRLIGRQLLALLLIVGFHPLPVLNK